ncbi:MAG: hypothetical protein FWE38_04590 [Firmicutes bacterium]|nr:hypothetical protein [Bacillota bacterium]
MIKSLIAYQDKEKEKLALVYSVEAGKTKRELTESLNAMEVAKKAVLELDSEAKNITLTIDGLKRQLDEIASKVTDVNKSKTDASEDELNSAIALASMVASRLVAYENQLVEIGKKINEKSTQFEAAKQKAARAQMAEKKLSPEYEREKAAIAERVTALEAELKKMERDVDAKLLERYKKRRANDRGGKPSDIVVPLVGDRCGGCHFELALSQTHKIGVDGYIVCEECGRIIYKQG